MLPLLLVITVLALVPLDVPSAWEVLAYRGIEPNQVTFDDGALTIRVERSAGPVVWALPEPRRVSGVRVRGVVTGQLRTTADRQGAQGADDFTLRVGLVETGTRRPSFVERRFAPRWVRQLFALAPPGEGVRGIRFFNLGLHASQIGWTRMHPLSDLIAESVVAVPDEEGQFAFSVAAGDAHVLGVWLSADGDDTGSTFQVRIDELALL